MDIMVAKTAGFCFGVKNAMKITYELINRTNEQIYTEGPLIHNKQAVDCLMDKGVKVIKCVEEINTSGYVIIRAHGVTPEKYKEIEKRNVKIIDATCPYVKKIHMLVREKFDEGYQIVIVGDKNHPEVIGINGWCYNTAYIVDNLEDIDNIPDDVKKICAVAQTTITSDKWEKINDFLKNKFENILKFDTICYATINRQKEAAELAKSVDMMIVIGGENSSNTQKLFEICKEYCQKTVKIETSGDLRSTDINKIKKIGITAGASTPDWVIKEVIVKMGQLDINDNEMSFKEAFEDSIFSLKTGDVVKGKIIGFNSTEIYVDLKYKSDGIIAVSEYSDEPDFKPEKSLNIGDEIEVFVIRVNDGEGNVLLSKKKVDSIKNMDFIEEAFEKKTTLKAKVIDVVSGGIIASVNGVRVFIPASQISDKYIKDLNEFLKQTINVRIIEYNMQKRRLIGSQRVILEEEKSRMKNDIWNSIEVNKKYEGIVKSITNFGAFVDIGGVDGLIHISEMSWSKIKHPSEVLKIGDKVDVVILEFDKEKRKISLGYRKNEDNPWNGADVKYKVGDLVSGKVVRLVPFGVFIELDDGIDGLVHISQISQNRINKPGDVLEIGQVVEAKIIEVNIQAKKINLSIKDVNPVVPAESDKADEQDVKNEDIVPSEHIEEIQNTIGDMINDIKIDK